MAKPAQNVMFDDPSVAECVRFSGVSLAFGTEKILDDLTFSVNRGEFCCVLGPSGCGKSTTLRLLGNLIQPESGQILVDDCPPSEVRQKLAFVFQSPRLVPWRNALKNVMLGSDLRFGRDAREQYQTAALRYLDMVNLADSAQKYPFMLSGGERQRVAIARALTVNPDIILMDEPFSALDINTRHRMQRQILDIWHTTRKTVLFVTHDVNEAITLADRIIVLSRKPTRVLQEILISEMRPRDVGANAALQKVRLNLARLLRSDAREDISGRIEDETPTISAALGHARTG